MAKQNRVKRDPKAEPSAHPLYDCIVVGAGLSGLACARQLLDAGKRVLILEGRERIGGRIFTQRESSMNLPIELGAEFIHGAPAVIFDRLQSAGLTFYDLTDEHLQRRGKELVPMDFFEKIQGVMESLDPERKTDRSIEDVLNAMHLDPNVEKLMRAYIEGFHAADPKFMGERALATAESGGSNLNGSESFRIVEGYDRFIASFLHGVATKVALVRLNTIVKKIRWQKSRVDIETVAAAGFANETLHAKCVVVTVPLGVLKAPAKSKTAIEFDPRPKSLDTALSGLHMGHALRLNLRFRSRFWEAGHKKPLGFLHAGPEKYFPTWWTQMPMRTPILTAWQGGPKVERLARLSESERVQTALQTLSYLLDLDIGTIQEELIAWYGHDWSNDPFSFGAYSYVGLNGDRLAAPLAEPFGNSLFFAGEATHTKAERGTVDGALATGLRVAQQVLEVL